MCWSSVPEFGARTAGILLATVLLALAPRATAAQGVACDDRVREVRVLNFEGNETFRDGELADRIVTTQSTLARRLLRIIGQRYCADSVVVNEDVARLLLFYNARGFTGTKVESDMEPDGSDGLEVTFRIAEGRPVVLDSLAINGLDVPMRERIVRDLPLKVGSRLDRDSLQAMRDVLSRRLRNQGYPTAEVFRNVDTDTSGHAVVWFDAMPGPRMRIDSVRVVVESQGNRAVGIPAPAARKALGLRTGQYYNEQTLESVKRAMYLSEAYRHVDVAVDSATLSDGDSLVQINIRLVEGDLRASRLSAGWGYFECLRLRGNLTTLNLLGGLRRLDLTGRLSRIGAGVPFDAAGGLCPSDVRDDPRSDTLNYYVSASYSQPALFGRRTLPSLTAFSERRFEYPTYVRDVPFGMGASLQRPSERYPMTFSYQVEYGATTAQPAYFCAVFNACDEATVQVLQRKRRTGIVGWSVANNRQDDLLNPTRGHSIRAELRHASGVVGSDSLVSFTKGTLDGTVVQRLNSGVVFVARLRAGKVLGSRFSFTERAEFVPPQERLYAGGPNSVRGFGQNELGPIVYVVAEFDTVQTGAVTTFEVAPDYTLLPLQPTGGENLLVANAELRFVSPIYPDLLQYAVFADAGEVWNRKSESVNSVFKRLTITPGLGIRVFTPIGPLRVDLAMGPRDLPPGPVYFRPSSLADTDLPPVYCLSPGNQLPVTLGGAGDPPQEAGQCPGTFQPVRGRSLLKRLRFQFSIGQAF